MLSLQAEALSKGYIPEPPTGAQLSALHYQNASVPTSQPGNTALSALQNLQPWAGNQPGFINTQAPPAAHPPQVASPIC